MWCDIHVCLLAGCKSMGAPLVWCDSHVCLLAGCESMGPPLVWCDNHVCLLAGCESMGGSNEFFDKFSVRYHTSVVLKQLWAHPVHRATIMAESANTQDNADFIRFINMLINDTTFLLDESLDTLKSIHETQDTQNDQETWSAQPRVRGRMC